MSSENDNQSTKKLKIYDHYENKSIFKILLMIFIPTLLTFLATVFNQFVDSILIANFTTDYYESVDFSIGNSLQSYALSYINIFTSLSFIVAIGTGIIYGVNIGKKVSDTENKNLLSQSITQNFLYVFMIMLILAITVPFYSGLVIRNSSYFSSDVDFYRREMTIYSVLLAANYIFVIMNNNFLRISKIEGNIHSATMISILPIIFNPVLDLIFMGGINFGIIGAGIAMLLSNFITFAIYIMFIFHLKSQDKTNIVFKFRIKFDKVFVMIFVLGSAATLRRFATSFEQISLLWVVARLRPIDGYNQEIWTTFFNTVIRLNSLFIVGGLAVSQSSGQLIGYFYGKGDREHLKKLIFLMFAIVTVIQFVSLLITIPLSPFILKIFGIKDILNDTVLRRVLIPTFTVISIGFAFETYLFIGNSLFNSIKRPLLNIYNILLTKFLSYILLGVLFVWIYQANDSLEPWFVFMFLIVNGIFSTVMTIFWIARFFKNEKHKDEFNEQQKPIIQAQ